MISRRGFFGAIAAALVLDPERLLWVPGRKSIFIPTPTVHTLTKEQIAKAIAAITEQQQFIVNAFRGQIFQSNVFSADIQDTPSVHARTLTESSGTDRRAHQLAERYGSPN